MSASEVDAQEAAGLELVLEAYQLMDIKLTKDPFRKPPDLNSTPIEWLVVPARVRVPRREGFGRARGRAAACTR